MASMGALLENTAGDSPNTVPSLLRELHAEQQPVHRQQDLLRHWLDDHDPSKPLRISLRANGYGLLLNEADAEHHKPKPVRIAPIRTARPTGTTRAAPIRTVWPVDTL